MYFSSLSIEMAICFAYFLNQEIQFFSSWINDEFNSSINQSSKTGQHVTTLQYKNENRINNKKSNNQTRYAYQYIKQQSFFLYFFDCIINYRRPFTLLVNARLPFISIDVWYRRLPSKYCCFDCCYKYSIVCKDSWKTQTYNH
jgi:hypothetical protein